MRNRRITLLVLSAGAAVAAAASGCIPGRDNPYDPATAPHAALVAIDATAPAGGCLTSLAEAEARAPTDRIARTRCLLLDASPSRDSARAILGSSARFEFAVVNSAGAVVSGLDGTPLMLQPPSAGRTLFVDASVLRNIAPGPQRFRVRVAAGGHVGEAIETVRVDNQPPTVGVESARAIIESGPPWLPSGTASLDVAFNARAADPDGSGLASRCWRFAPEGGSPSCGADDATTAAPLGSDGRVVGLYSATDLDGATTDGVAVLEATPALYWRFGVEQQIRSSRQIDRAGSRTSPVIPVPGATGSQIWTAAPIPDAGGVLGSYLVSVGVSNHDYLAWEPFPAGAPVVATNEALAYTKIAAIPGAPEAWALGGGEIAHVRIVGGAPQTAETISVPAATRLAATSDGSAWLASDTELFRVRSGGAIDEFLFPSGSVVALLDRPGTDEAWILTTDATGWNLYRAHGSAPSLDVGLIYSDAGLPTAMAWTGTQELWLALASDGAILRLDASAIESAAPRDAATTLTIPYGAVASLLPDVLTGSVFVFGDAPARIDASGLVLALNGVPSGLVPLFVDTLGDVWSLNGFNVSYSASSVAGGEDVAARASTVARTDEAVDAFGRFWTADEQVPAVTIYAADGTIGDSITIPGFAPKIVRPSPDGVYAWLGSNDRIDLVRREPAGNVDLGFIVPSGALPFLSPTGFHGDVLVPSAPGAAPFLWAVAFTTSARVFAIDTAGGQSLIAPLPTAERIGFGPYSFDGHGALFARSNRLCLADVEDSATAPFLHVRSIDRNGTVLEGTKIALDPNDGGQRRLVSVSTVSDASGERCWVGVASLAAPTASTAWSVHVYDASANLLTSYTEAQAAEMGKLDSLVALSSTLARATIERSDSSGIYTTEVQIDIGAGSTTDLSSRRGGYLLASPFSTLTVTFTVP